MLFKFKSAAASDLIMLELDARKLLQIMLGDDPVQGIMLADTLAQRIRTLEEAVAHDEALRKRLARGERRKCEEELLAIHQSLHQKAHQVARGV